MELRPSATWMGNWFVRDHAGSCSFLLRSRTRSQDSVGLYARMEIVDESQDSCARPRPATAATTLWQREYFDHVLRSDESYAEKWDYVRENPVRAGLVRSSNDWP